MSTIKEIFDLDEFMWGYEKQYWTRIRNAHRHMRSPDVMYHVKITGKESDKNNAAFTMLEWCLENIERVPKVRTEYAAISSTGDYFFLSHADALAFYFRFGDEFK